MSVTQEDLEMAALAAGMTPVRMSDDGEGLLVAEQPDPWRPHTGIADAARLALLRRVCVEFDDEAGPGDVTASCLWRGQMLAKLTWHDGTESDKLRAYCEAVTLCAAEIGRQMKDAAK